MTRSLWPYTTLITKEKPNLANAHTKEKRNPDLDPNPYITLQSTDSCTLITARPIPDPQVLPPL